MSRIQAIYNIDVSVENHLHIVEKDAPRDMDISYIRDYAELRPLFELVFFGNLGLVINV